MENPRDRLRATMALVISKRSIHKYEALQYAERILKATAMIEEIMAEINHEADDGKEENMNDILAASIMMDNPEALMEVREEILQQMQPAAPPITEDDILDS